MFLGVGELACEVGISANLGLVYSASLDLGFALYPCLRISRLQMKRSKKILIAGALSLGIMYVNCKIQLAGLFAPYRQANVSV